jgi:hypothetical protein
MDFSRLIAELTPKINRLTNILNDPSVSPELRKSVLQNALNQVGQSIYGKSYDMTAWDMEIAETIGAGMDPNIALGLARNLSDSVATGNKVNAIDQVNTYAQNAAGVAMAAAFSTAGQLGKYRTLRVTLRGRGDCDWCRARAARGTIANPTNQDFSRHDHCDCYIVVKGYMSRNGLLANYAVRS